MQVSQSRNAVAPGPFRHVLGEGGGVEQPDAFAHGLGLVDGILPPAAAPEAARIVVEGLAAHPPGRNSSGVPTR